MIQEERNNPLIKEVPGHLFKFEEKIWGMTLQQLLTDLGVLTGSITFAGSLPLIPRIIVCVFVTIMTMILVHGKAQGHSLGFLLFLYVRSKTVPSWTTWRSERIQSNKSEHMQGKKRFSSVQATWVPVATLKKGVMGNDAQRKKTVIPRYWMIFEVEGRNVHLLPEQEQIRIYKRFESFLTGLEFHLQFLSYTEPMNPKTAPSLLDQEEALTSLSSTPRLHALQKASLQEQIRQMPTCTLTRHFVVVAASGAEAALRNPDSTPHSILSAMWNVLTLKRPPEVTHTHVLDQLRSRASIVKKSIQQLDMRIWLLQDTELLQLFARTLVPGSAVPTFVPELVEEQKRLEMSRNEDTHLHSRRAEQDGEDQQHKNSTMTISSSQVASTILSSPHQQVQETEKARRNTSKRYKKRIKGMHSTFYYKSKNEQARFESGVLDLADLIAPSSVQVCPESVEVTAEGQTRYIRSFIVTGYGHHLLCGWMNALHELGLPMLISSHFEPIDSRLMIMRLEQHQTKLESSRLDDQKTLRVTKADHNIEAEQIRLVSKALASKRLKIFDLSMTICIHASSLERLEQRSRYLLSHLRDMQVQVRPATLQQDLAWQSCLPMSLDTLQNWVKLPSDVCSTFLPGTSGSVGTPTGVFLGYTGSGLSRRPVYFNPWDRNKKIPNPHLVVVGETGMGKSWLGKTIVTGFLGLALADVVVLDRDDDYLALHEALGGESQRYNLARSCPLNLLDIPFAPADVDPNDPADILAEFFDNYLITGLSLLLTDEETKLSKGEEAFLIQVARRTYGSVGITSEAIRHNPDTLLLPAPTLPDFIEMMKSMPTSSEGMRQSLLERLEKASYLFQASHTEVSLEKPLTIFSIKELDEKWYALMTYVVQNFLMRHRAIKRDERYLAYVVEEASYLLRHPAGRRYLESGSRGFRKLGIAQITLSQHPRDFLDAGQVVLSNAGTVFYLGMQQQAAEKLKLPEELERVITESIPGQCVMRCGSEYAALTVWSNPVYKDIFTTDPAEGRDLRAKERKRKHHYNAVPA